MEGLNGSLQWQVWYSGEDRRVSGVLFYCMVCLYVHVRTCRFTMLYSETPDMSDTNMDLCTRAGRSAADTDKVHFNRNGNNGSELPRTPSHKPHYRTPTHTLV